MTFVKGDFIKEVVFCEEVVWEVISHHKRLKGGRISFDACVIFTEGRLKHTIGCKHTLTTSLTTPVSTNRFTLVGENHYLVP